MHDAGDPEEVAKWSRWFAIECNNRASPAWQVAFAHAVLAHATFAARDAAAHAKHYEIARRLGAALPEGDRATFDATFRVIPAPPAVSPASAPALPSAREGA